MAAPTSWGATLILDDGRELEGRVTEISGVVEDPTKTNPSEVAVQPIVLVDDGLRRTYVWQRRITKILEQAPQRPVRFRPWQNVAERGGAVGTVGRRLGETPFDQYGRRHYTMAAKDGPLTVVQGITELTPVYAKVEGLMGGERPIVWDMRLATSSIPPDDLKAILHQAIDTTDINARKEIVRFYSQAERYPEAYEELQQIVSDFPDVAKDSADILRQLNQLAARSILDEIALRRNAGQHALVRTLLDRFPADDVAGETLQKVRELLTEYDGLDVRYRTYLEHVAKTIAAISDPVHRGLAEKFLQEVSAELSYATLDRTAAYTRLADDETLSAEQKVALAISGWLLGSDDAVENFAVASSLMQVRDLVLAYLRESEAAKRAALVTQIRELEGGVPERVAQILRRMKPPMETPVDAEGAPGCARIAVEMPAPSGLAYYHVQLPPEYDPLRAYPTIVTLNGEGYAPELQLDYWAGSVQPQVGRRAQAMRHGYITIAVDWQTPHQFRYDYSLREHQTVLGAVRDAMRRFSIDTDRIFLTGHDIGGDAAWDIGLAHPDLWAGVIPYLAVSRRYVPRYRDNGKLVDWYFVAGERDGGKMAQNAPDFDKYLRPGFNCTLVEYHGRGHEPYHDEIQRVFDWMNRRTRRPPPAEFSVSTMRPWDNYFWWMELSELPDGSMVPPASWPPKRGQRAASIQGRVYGSNKISVRSGAKRTTIWLRPELVDFDQPVTIEVNGRRVGPRDRTIVPDLGVLLEDARTRCDRKNPYWAKVSTDDTF